MALLPLLTTGITTNVGDPIIAPFQDLWAALVAALPQVLAALLVFLFGWMIAVALGAVAAGFIKRIKLDDLADKTGIKAMFKMMNLPISIAGIIGWAVKWFFIIVFLIAAADILGWTAVTEFMGQVALYIPNVIVAIIILAIGLVAGKFVEDLIRKGMQTTRMDLPPQMPLLGRMAVIVFAVLAALAQLGIAGRMVEILFGGIVLALALAFGLGGREKAAEILRGIGHRRSGE